MELKIFQDKASGTTNKPKDVAENANVKRTDFLFEEIFSS